MEGNSYILKVIQNKENQKNIFVCNRNSRNFNLLYKDKYIKWFEYNSLPNIMDMNVATDISILEILYGWDNYNHRHQGDINPIKKKYLSSIQESLDDDETITNVVISNFIKSTRQSIKLQYNQIKDRIISLSYDTIYKIIKDIWFNKRYIDAIDKPRYKFKTDNDIGIVAIIFRDYLLKRKKSGNRFPFDKKSIRQTIKFEIRTHLL